VVDDRFSQRGADLRRDLGGAGGQEQISFHGDNLSVEFVRD
jgi:hypothetical protein